MESERGAHASLGAIAAECRGRVLAALVSTFSDFELAEDALQDALVRALERWPEQGLPSNPGGWLFQTARRNAIDRLRRTKTATSKQAALMADDAYVTGIEGEEEDMQDFPDDRLRLIFTCCHPALARPAQVALTLKTLGRLSTAEIARAYLTPESTMAQRLVRAKRKIKDAGIPYRVPPPKAMPERLGAVLEVVYLIFNEGYAATDGKSVARAELCEEAIRLGRILAELAQGESEAAGLLALMLLHDARRHARTGADGQLMTLENQDRGRWDKGRIEEGQRALQSAGARTSTPGPYQLQAEISGTHCAAQTYAETDWKRIAGLYDRLFAIHPNAVVRINGAVALSFAHGPEIGLQALAPLDGDTSMERYAPFHLARADMLRRSGQVKVAAESYRCALALTQNEAERGFIKNRLKECTP